MSYLQEFLNLIVVTILNVTGFNLIIIITGLQRRFRHHVPYQLYLNCRNHKLALCVKHLMLSFPVLQDVDSLLLSVWKLFHYSPQKYVIFMDVQKAYGLKNLKMIRAAATRWLSHGRACRRLIERYVQVLDALDEMIDRKHDPEIDGLRNMLCSKGTLAGILILCDLLEPVIVFSDYLQGASIDFSHVNKKAKDLTDALHTLTERFHDSIQTPDADLYFSKMPALFMEIDERTILMRRLHRKKGNDGVYDPEHLVNEVAVPITHHLIQEIEDAFRCSPVLCAFNAFRLESDPDDIQELKDYKKVY
ncbi:uncharacterized protein LOC132723924 [Ruditapes philippinarum]|uniref:uncharacterized protein LOC132723924 n=1 Tax=Ruditapes philippinarum TaxID=129788 RepID=UPI00295A8EE0|nr:uncharacterized protein LOC132723924 [Ruditapes philippinarum]